MKDKSAVSDLRRALATQRERRTEEVARDMHAIRKQESQRCVPLGNIRASASRYKCRSRPIFCESTIATFPGFNPGYSHAP